MGNPGADDCTTIGSGQLGVRIGSDRWGAQAAPALARTGSLVVLSAFLVLANALHSQSYSEAPAQGPTVPTSSQLTSSGASGQTHEGVTEMGPVLVTGSNIPQAIDAVGVPLSVIDASVMDESGVNADTLDILRKVEPSVGGVGSENAQANSDNNFGGAGAYINGLPTLVLLDGRRVVNDPAGASGGAQFVDLNLIPPAAIERVEILTTGASAIYGSDAIGGVINIILKKDYNGWETGVHYGYSGDTGHYSERSASVVGGFSDGKTSFTVSLDYYHRDPLFLKDRSYSSVIHDTDTHPGVIDIYDVASGNDTFYELAPGVNAPPKGGNYTIAQLVAQGVYVPKTEPQVNAEFNLANGITLTDSLNRYSAMVNMEHRFFTNRLVGFADLLLGHTYVVSQLNGQPLEPYLQDAYIDNNFYWGFTPPPAGTTFVPASSPSNPFSSAFVDQAGDGQTGELVTVRDRFNANPRLNQETSDLFRMVAGLRGDIHEFFHWEAAANFGRYSLDYTNPGLIDTAVLDAGLADGQINPFAITQAPGALDSLFGEAQVRMVSTQESFDFKIEGTPFELPSGRPGFALGSSYLREGLSADPDANSLPNSQGNSQGWSNAPVFYQFSTNRSVTSEFTELTVPVTSPSQKIPMAHAINVDAAVRYDGYSGTTGGAVDPEYNIAWAPFDDQLKFRASVGRSFAVPQLYDLYGPVSVGQTAPITYSVYNGNGAQNTEIFNVTSGSNPSLKPTTAKTWTAGVVYTPGWLKGLSISVDYVDDTQEQMEGTIPSDVIVQSVELQGTASPFASYVHFDGPEGAPVTGPGSISGHPPLTTYVTGTNVNVGAEKIDTVAIKVDFKRRIPNFGQLHAALSWSWYDRVAYQEIPDMPFYNYDGEVSNTFGTAPKWIGYSTLDYSRKAESVFVGCNFVGSTTDVYNGGASPTGFSKVGSFTQYDLGVSYDFRFQSRFPAIRGLKLTLGLNNVFNKMPPEAPDVFPGTNADVGTYGGAIGRMFYLNARFKF